MNVYAPKSGPLSKAFLQVVGLTDTKLVPVDDQKSAEIVLLTGTGDLRALYTSEQIFCVLQVPGQLIGPRQPENVCVIDSTKIFVGDKSIKQLIDLIAKRKVLKSDSVAPKVRRTKFSDVAVFQKGYSVLIVDDSKENLSIAMQVLPGQQILPVQTMEEAMRYLRMKGKTFDAVLTDMHMLPDKTYSSLNLDTYGLKETVPYGFAMMLEATSRGIPVAIVTDANHHQDWVSAMFDNIHNAEVNGQKVLFFNNIGKRWDTALKALMEG